MRLRHALATIALVLLLSAAPVALAQDNGSDVDVDIGDDREEESNPEWWANGPLMLLVAVLAALVIALVVAVAVRR